MPCEGKERERETTVNAGDRNKGTEEMSQKHREEGNEIRMMKNKHQESRKQKTERE